MWYYIAIGALLFLLVLVAVIIPKRLDSQGNGLKIAVKGLVDDYFLAHTEHDLEKRKLKFHKLTVTTDRVLGHLLSYLGCRDSSVKQQIRMALQKQIVTYDQFQGIKRFHHMRNEVVHEGLEIFGDNEHVVYGALGVMKSLLGV